jgi:hypothetical protein
VLVLHGARDPRTEPGELDALRAALESGRRAATAFAILSEGAHSPHSESATADEVNGVAERFLAGVADAASPAPPAHPARS